MKLGIYKLSVLKKSPPYYSWSEFLCCYPPQAVVRQAGFGRQCLSHLLQPSQQILALGRRQLPGSQCPHLGSRPCRPPGPLSLVSPQPQLILCFFSTHSPSSVGQIWEDQEENSCCACPVPCSLFLPHSVLSPHPADPVSGPSDRPKLDRSRTVVSGQVGLSPLSPTRRGVRCLVFNDAMFSNS